MASFHNHKPWRKAILVPFWIIQLLLQLLLIALLAFAIGVLATWENSDSTDFDNLNGLNKNAYRTATQIVVPIWITMITVCLILTVTEIIMLAKHALKPLVFVIMNTIKSTIWTVIFVLDIISVVDKSTNRTASMVSVLIEAVLLLCYYIPLIYGSIIYHRERTKAATYKPVDGKQAFPTMSTEYPSQYKAFVQEEVDLEAAPISTAQPDGARRLSYNHQRDTRFDSFRQDRENIGGYGDLSSMGSYGELRGFGSTGSPTNGRSVSSGSGSEPNGLKMSPPMGMMSPPPEIHIENLDGEVFEMASNKNRRSL